jgi:hypothetical protein
MERRDVLKSWQKRKRSINLLLESNRIYVWIVLLAGMSVSMREGAVLYR